MKTANIILLLSAILCFYGCKEPKQKVDKNLGPTSNLAKDVKKETLRSWQAYRKYAWGHDNLLPLSKNAKDWYEEPLYISLIDAYSTLKLMGFTEECKEIEEYVVANVDFDKDIFVKTFEVNIRILGGLLSMYELTQNEAILERAIDFGDRMLQAFDSKTGLPYYYFNLKTGETKGRVINLAEAGSFVFELGILSYYTQNPEYYQTGKNASKKVFSLRSNIGLLGRDIDVETGEWLVKNSMVGAYADSFFEYLYKGYLLFGDPELKQMWDQCLPPIMEHLAIEQNGKLWFGKADMNSGEFLNAKVTLWDAYFPALLGLSDNLDKAKSAWKSWNYLWNKNGLVPRVYDFQNDTILEANYHLNPEVIESAYYLSKLTQDPDYTKALKGYYQDLKDNCRNNVAYHSVKSVISKEADDELSTFFFAETMKYFYLAFTDDENLDFSNFVFSTEAHPFLKRNFNQDLMTERLNITY